MIKSTYFLNKLFYKSRNFQAWIKFKYELSIPTAQRGKMAETQYSAGQGSLPRDTFYAEIQARGLHLDESVFDFLFTRSGLLVLHCSRYGGSVIGVSAEDHTRPGTPALRLLSTRHMNGRPLTSEDAQELLRETRGRIRSGQITPSASIDGVVRQE